MEEIYCNVWDEKKKNTIKNIIEDCIQRNINDQAVYITKQLKKYILKRDGVFYVFK